MSASFPRLSACTAGLLLFLCLSAAAQYRSYDNRRYRDYNNRSYRDYNSRDYNNRNYRNYRSYPTRYDRVVVHRYYPPPVVVHRAIPYRYYAPPVYRGFGASVTIIAPSMGVHIGALPLGHCPVWIGPRQFYYYQGTYYRRAARDYEVVDAPIGAEVPDLPERARVVVIDNNKYYELDGTFYRETVRPNGEIWYTVTGKDGDEVVQLPRDKAPAAGDVVSSLPQGCKVIVLNNQKYFVAPDGTYYQEVIENNQIFYKVAGTPE